MKGRQRLIALLLYAGVLITLIPFFIFQAKASEQWLWPLDQCYVVLSNFGYRDLDGNGSLEDTHRGIDIIREPQDSTRGLPVRAAKSGTIITSKTNCTHFDKKGDCGCNGGAGNYVVIQHPDGTYSRYLHLLQSGVHGTGAVAQGETIGYVGTSGQSWGYHLHFDMCTDINNRANTMLNPMPTNSNITIKNVYSLPSGWPSQKTTYIFSVGPHTHDKGTYMYYYAEHPHYNCYKCSVCGTIWADRNSSNVIDSCDQCVKPGKPVITGLSSNYLPQETITVQWTYGENTTHCNYWLYKHRGDNWIAVNRINYASSPVTETLDAGDYRVQIVATNSNASGWPYTDSDFAYFSVGETRGTKISFDPQGGHFSDFVRSCAIHGMNRGRGQGETILYTSAKPNPNTNKWGAEIAISSSGVVTAIRGYGDETPLSVPSGGFVLSTHADDSVGIALINSVSVGDYVGVDLSTGTAFNYGRDDSAYLSENLYLHSSDAFGSLPVPTREGYYFAGWYDAPSGGNRIRYGNPVSTTNLYARWDAVQDAAPIYQTAYHLHLYEVYDYNMSWAEARAFCEARGGHLVTITDNDEQQIVKSMIQRQESGSSNGLYYIGCTDEESEGTWKWITGEPFDYAAWDAIEPSDSGGTENYGAIMAVDYGANKTVGEWIDTTNKEPVIWFYAYSNAGFVCEYDTICDHNYSVTDEKAPTCTEAGYKTYTCSECGDTRTETSAALGHDFEVQTIPPTCTGYEQIVKTCKRCGLVEEEIGEIVDVDWSEEKPAGVDEKLIHTKTQYCYSDYETITSDSPIAPDGWELKKVDLEQVNSGTISYVKSWPAGFSRNHSLFGQYNQTPKSAGETQTSKTTISESVQGYLYYHWCRGVYTGGPINRKTSPEKSGEFTAFHAFYSTTDPSSLSNTGSDDGSYIYPNASACTDSHWYYPVQVTKQDYAEYRKLFTYGHWTAMSEWSDTEDHETSTHQVKTRTFYWYPTSDGNHQWDDGVITTAPTCTEPGVKTTTCTACGRTMTETLPALGHDYENGVCTRCGEADPHVLLKLSAVSGKAGDLVRIPVVIERNTGFASFALEVISDEEIVLTDIAKGELLSTSESGAFIKNTRNGTVSWTDSENLSGDGVLFYLTFKIMDDAEVGDFEVKLSLKDDLESSFADADGEAIPYSAEIGKVTVVKDVPPPDPDPNPFVDVEKGKFYYDPVLWAFYHDPVVTTGVDATHFAPDRICTRAHVVAFLWRANGCPEPQSLTSSFKDVKDTNKYYYKAVLWAAEQGITTGYSDGTFRPDDECTRGQVVTFLWRAKGSPNPTGASNPFTDVPSGKYYTYAVLWALKNNITQGRTPTTFGPDDACTRGHVVTFLYRAYAD